MNYGIDPSQLRELVVVPTLKKLDMCVPVAVSLVLGTAMHESHLTYLKQLGTGPALGLWQMEPATHDDCWINFLKFRTDLAATVKMIAGQDFPQATQMIGNLYYACAMARIRYRRVPANLPNNNALELATFWKQWYNTPLGKGTIAEAAPHFAAAVALTP